MRGVGPAPKAETAFGSQRSEPGSPSVSMCWSESDGSDGARSVSSEKGRRNGGMHDLSLERRETGRQRDGRGRVPRQPAGASLRHPDPVGDYSAAGAARCFERAAGPDPGAPPGAEPPRAGRHQRATIGRVSRFRKTARSWPRPPRAGRSRARGPECHGSRWNWPEAKGGGSGRGKGPHLAGRCGVPVAAARRIASITAMLARPSAAETRGPVSPRITAPKWASCAT